MLKASWSTILADVDAVLDLCRSLRLGDHVETSRFLTYRDHLTALQRALEQDGPKGAFEIFESDQIKSVVTLTECAELADLRPFLEATPRDTLGDKLVHVLKGPVLPTNEDTNSNQARNILFELNLASKLWKAGLAPELGEHPDLAVEVDSKTLLIQCKRPFYVGGAGRALSSAKSQLHRDLGGASPGSRGVVALSLSRLLNPGDKIYSYSDEASARKNLSDKVQAATDPLLARWGHPGKKIIGLICHVTTPAVDESISLPMVVQQTNVHGFAQPGTHDDAVFRSFYKALEKIWY